VVSLQVSQPEQFTAKVTGTGNFDPSVQWFVNDVAGGNSSVGTVIAGLYTAPAQVPNPSTVSIEAVAAADSTKSAPAQATIHAILAPTVVWNETNLSLPGGDDGEVFDSEIPPGIGVADDGAGGAYVVWEHRFPVEILAQHLDASGSPTWAAGGILVTNPWTGYQAMPRVVSDGAGGVIVVWLDGRAGSCDESFMADCEIYGQRLDSAGALLWGSAGIPVSTAANDDQGVNGLAMVSDAAGGAIVAFSDSRADEGVTVYAQRIDTSGNPVWPVNGVLLGQQPNGNDTPQIAQVELISDGSGGAIGGWYFTSYIAPSTISLRTQRISASGQLMWGSSPVAVPGVSASDPNGTGVQTFGMTTDGSGGAIIVASWEPQSATVPVVLAQRISSTGSIAWSQSGMEVSNSANTDLNPAALTDGSGGVFAAWQDCPNGGNCNIAMQHLNASGQTTWGANQVYISQEPNLQLAPTLQPNGTGGALVMWTDCRNYPDLNSCEANSDVYAQDVDASGNSLWQLNGYPLLVDPGNQGEQYYVYTPAPATVSVRLQSGDIFLAWPDGRDGVCFTGNAASACEVFVERFGF
jgi:hypothetical protein